MSDPKDWDKYEWAKWASKFCNLKLLGFDPLNDLNHLGLVLDEIERRKDGKRQWEWRMRAVHTVSMGTVYYCDLGFSPEPWIHSSGAAPSCNLAVLLAAKELVDSDDR